MPIPTYNMVGSIVAFFIKGHNFYASGAENREICILGCVVRRLTLNRNIKIQAQYPIFTKQMP